MIKSETITKIAPAFLKAQKAMDAVTKDAKNPFFKSNYASLNAVMDVCKAPLNDNGILVMQPVNGEYVETVLIHESGEWFACQTALVVAKQNDPQALGSAISYARRYGLMSMLGLPAEDDDAESAMSRNRPVEKEQTTEPALATVLERRDAQGHRICELCGKAVDDKVADYSIEKYGAVRCYTCQRAK